MRWIANLVWTVAGVLLVAVCLRVFERVWGEGFQYLALAAVIAAGAVVWFLDVRRPDLPPDSGSTTSD